MKTKTLLLQLAILGGATFTLTAADVRLDECPAPVRDTIQANLRDGKLDEIEMIKVEDRTLYVADVELPSDKDLKIHVNGEGKLLKTSEDITLSELPAPVKAAAEKAAAGQGQIEDADKEIADGKTTFLIEVDRANAPDLDLVVAGDGAIVSQREEAKD